MTDALTAMFDDAAYKELQDEANKDDRAGDHNAIITKITDDLWPSGDPRRKILFSLLTAGNAKADLTIGDIPSPAIVKEQLALPKGDPSRWPSKTFKAISSAVTIAQQFAQHYGKNPRATDGETMVREGDQYRVKTVKTKQNPDGSGGFIRVIAILPPAGSANGSAPVSGGPGF